MPHGFHLEPGETPPDLKTMLIAWLVMASAALCVIGLYYFLIRP